MRNPETAMDLFVPPPAGGAQSQSCCFCGEALDQTALPPARVWLELPAPTRSRIMREYYCHEACFQKSLAPAHRTGSGRPIARSPDGVILNAHELTADDLVQERVLCPACGGKTFAMWPEGWDSHAAHRCTGVRGASPEARKAAFKQAYGHLFR
jgi:hypothetical protein